MADISHMAYLSFWHIVDRSVYFFLIPRMPAGQGLPLGVQTPPGTHPPHTWWGGAVGQIREAMDEKDKKYAFSDTAETGPYFWHMPGIYLNMPGISGFWHIVLGFGICQAYAYRMAFAIGICHPVCLAYFCTTKNANTAEVAIWHMPGIF